MANKVNSNYVYEFDVQDYEGAPTFLKNYLMSLESLIF